MPAAVVFDFFGTLTPRTPEHVWDEDAARSAAPLGLDPRTWRRALTESFGERITGSLGDLPATFRTLALRCGVDPTEQALAAACAARRATQAELFTLRADGADTLARLRARQFRLGVLSDCSVELADAWPGLPLARLVDARVLSCEEGRRKPDPELYRLIVRRLGVDPAQCLYLGDGAGGELAGAAACGMRAVQLVADRDVSDSLAREHWAGESVRSLSAVLTLAG